MNILVTVVVSALVAYVTAVLYTVYLSVPALVKAIRENQIPGPQGPKGDKGDKGDKGEPGKSYKQGATKVPQYPPDARSTTSS